MGHVILLRSRLQTWPHSSQFMKAFVVFSWLNNGIVVKSLSSSSSSSSSSNNNTLSPLLNNKVMASSNSTIIRNEQNHEKKRRRSRARVLPFVRPQKEKRMRGKRLSFVSLC